MKTFIYSIFMIVAIVGCSSLDTSMDKNAPTTGVKNDTIRIANDSLEYEVIIIEPGFYGWLPSQPPRGYLTQSSMEISNLFKVQEYNLRTRDGIRYKNSLYPFPIDYERNVDYGYEVNYMIYNYFLFFEQKYNQRLK